MFPSCCTAELAQVTDCSCPSPPQVQQDLIATVRSVAKKVVLVIVSGSAVPFNESAADAVVYAMYGGEEAGNGLADVLFGDVVPSGRLPFTIFTKLEQMRSMEDYDLTSQPGRTHLYYDDSSVGKLGSPQWWFGFGMSYSSFHYSNLLLSAASCRVMAAVTVTNVGKVAAREVAQLYLGRPKPANNVPVAAWALKGYQRTDVLAAGASVTLHFEVNARELSTVMSDGSRHVPAGVYKVQIGGANPRETRAPATPINGSVRVAAGCSAYQG